MQNYFRKLEKGAERVCRLGRSFFESFDITYFSYCRIFPDGHLGWVTTTPEQDRMCIESNYLNYENLFDTCAVVNEGHYLWFHDKTFPGSDIFYQQRQKCFNIDHGTLLVTKEKDYIKTYWFGGLIAKRPLYNLFIRELGLFRTFAEHFTNQIPASLMDTIEERIHISKLKASWGIPLTDSLKRDKLLSSLGCGSFLKLSQRESECLALLKAGHTYQSMGHFLSISPRTVEQYIVSIKNKLNLSSQIELVQIAHRLCEKGLLPSFT